MEVNFLESIHCYSTQLRWMYLSFFYNAVSNSVCHYSPVPKFNWDLRFKYTQLLYIGMMSSIHRPLCFYPASPSADPSMSRYQYSTKHHCNLLVSLISAQALLRMLIWVCPPFLALKRAAVVSPTATKGQTQVYMQPQQDVLWQE